MNFESQVKIAKQWVLRPFLHYRFTPRLGQSGNAEFGFRPIVTDQGYGYF